MPILGDPAKKVQTAAPSPPFPPFFPSKTPKRDPVEEARVFFSGTGKKEKEKKQAANLERT